MDPNPIQTNPLGTPSLFPHPLISLTLQYNHQHHDPKPLLQTNPVLAINSAIRSVIFPMPLSRDFFLPPRATIAPSTAPPWPPPKPPPSDQIAALKGSCALGLFVSSDPSHLKLPLKFLLFVGLALIRPPPKPPWTRYWLTALLRLCMVYGNYMGGSPSLLILFHARTSGAPIMFDKSPHRNSGVFWFLLCALWQFIVTVGTYVTSTYGFDLSKCLSAIEYRRNLVNPENKYSRNVPFRSQKSSVIG